MQCCDRRCALQGKGTMRTYWLIGRCDGSQQAPADSDVSDTS